MRTLFAVAVAAGVCLAQDKVSVPLSSPNQPATLKVNLIHGSVTVTGGASGQVVVESSSSSKAPAKADDHAPAGMHRIDVSRAGIEAEEEHNVVTVSAGHAGMGGNLTIQVPTNSSLNIKIVSGGHLEVTGVNGDIEVENVNGPISLKNVSGSVVAHSVNGSVTAALDKVTADKPMSFSTLNGKIDVTLPGDTKARLRLKTDNGSVYTDFEVKMEADTSKPTVEESRGGQNAKYRIRMDRSVYGSINGGGPEYRFETTNGSILIHKK